MIPTYQSADVEIYHTDSRKNPLPDGIAQTCITSPPYWGLRDYGVADQIGNEPTPEEYVANLVTVFREVRRVLKDDGTLWLNLGDTYQNAKGQSGGVDPKQSARRHGLRPNDKSIPGLKPKDLVGIPWLVAFALRTDGWYLRSEIIWNKKSCTPESVKDRPTKSHEQLFLLSKSSQYFYDHEAIKEIAIYGGTADRKKRAERGSKSQPTKLHNAFRKPPEAKRGDFGGKSLQHQGRESFKKCPEMRNKRSVWSADEDAILIRWLQSQPDGQALLERFFAEQQNKSDVWTVAPKPYCGAHFAVFPPALIEPCVKAGSRPGDLVIDPFNGSGTTAEVSQKWHRRYAGLELNPEYIELSANRLSQSHLFTADDEDAEEPIAQTTTSDSDNSGLFEAD